MRNFSGGDIDNEVLARLLTAAHQGPSVGFMQPWRFLRIKSLDVRRAIHGLVEDERCLTAKALGERSDHFMTLKVEGILECAEVWVAALMDDRESHVFGRRTMPQMDLASVACAIQNLWLAARVEGLGMGWVSLFDSDRLATLLGMPPGAEPIAILCLGPVDEFYPRPMLESDGWATRRPLEHMLYEDLWGKHPSREMD
ncbi:5,6-dimethylbenzimidazole synthase [soil metagenome]